MSEKSAVDKEVLGEAYRRGYDYCKRIACAPGVFAAIMETLGYEDDPKVNDVWKATLGLIGGTGNMAIGTCGAMAGAAMAISYSFGFTRKNLQEDPGKMLKVVGAVAEVGKKMQEKYDHIQCQEVQFHNWGKSYRFTYKIIITDNYMQKTKKNLSNNSKIALVFWEGKKGWKINEKQNIIIQENG